MTIYEPGFGYVYKITNNVTNEIYFGSRTATINTKTVPEKDLWITYFTSSSIIEGQIIDYGKHAFTTEILYVSNDGDDIFWKEQTYIKQNIDSPLCLNKHYRDRDSGHKVFSTHGRDPWNKGKKTGPQTEQHRLKNSISNMGNQNGRFGKGKPKADTSRMRGAKTETHKANISLAKQGFKYKKVECPNCNRQVGVNSASRYHFTNCKHQLGYDIK